MIRRRFLLSFLVAYFCSATVHAKLRGINHHDFEVLKQRATHPVLRSDIQGKTVRELRGEASPLDVPPEKKGVMDDLEDETTTTRSLQTSTGTKLQFYTIYDEFGPPISQLGQTAGLNGLIYNMSSYATGQPLTKSDVIGALKGSCSGVSTKNDQLCTYELLVASSGAESFGSVVTSGSLTYKAGGGGYLIVEAAGDDFAQYGGGILTLQYQTIGAKTIVMLELTLSS